MPAKTSQTQTSSASQTLSVLGYDSSKAEEIAFIQAVAALAGEGSYLSGLFNPEAVAWIIQQMQADNSPDLFDGMLTQQALYAEYQVKAQRQYSDLAKAATDWEQKALQMSLMVARLEKDLGAAQAALVEAHEALTGAEQETQGQQEQIRTLAADLQTERSAHAETRQKCDSLKLRLFNVLYPETA